LRVFAYDGVHRPIYLLLRVRLERYEIYTRRLAHPMKEVVLSPMSGHRN
jgi:hypothetical protein